MPDSALPRRRTLVPRLARLALIALLAAGSRPALAAPPPGTPIPNTAITTHAGGGSTPSNTVIVIVQAGTFAPPELAFHSGPGYAQTIRVTGLAQPLYVQAVAPACDRDASRPDTVALTLRSLATGDQEIYRAVESGPATGRFRVEPDVPTTLASGSSGDGALALRRGGEVVAELAGCGATSTEARVWVEPVGLVFDARGGGPVAGVQVALIDVTGAGNGGAAGGPARVWLDDGVTPAPNVATSDALGRFQFPRVAPSTYRFAVTPPAPWTFPAPVPPASLPAGFLVDPAGSYGAPFTVGPADAPVTLDLPVDAGPGVTLFAEKSASRPQVELGEALEYSVRIANRSDSSFASATLIDRLPPGFAYLAGSARRDGVSLADPAGGAGPRLEFALGALAPGAVAEVAYAVRVGAGAVFGDALNRAIASAGRHESNEAVARVRVEEGVFAQSATVVGSVRLEWHVVPGGPVLRADAGAVQPPTVLPATGVAGIRVWLDDGTFAITDANGRYSLTGITPRTHALKVDPSTLPAGARLVAQDHRDRDQPGLRFVDLVRGDLQRADFMLQGDSVAVREVGERLLASAARRDDLSRALARGTAPLVAAPAAGDPRALPAHGVSTGEDRLPLGAWNAAASAAPAMPAGTAGPSGSPSGPLPLEQLARTLDPELGFVGHSDLDTMRSTQVAVRVKGPIGTVLTLRVNGERLSEARVGLRLTVPETGVEAWEYVGVDLRPGINRLEVAPPRSLGRVALRLVAPGPLARLELTAPARAPADGRTQVPVRIRTLDAAGIPNGARTLVTLEAGTGAWQTPDLDPELAGTQTAVEGGELVVALVAPGTSGLATLRASSGPLRAEAMLRFVPDLSPLLAVGSLEGVVGFGGRGAFAGGPEREAARFEAGIEQFASSRRDGRAMAAAHGALFARGRLRDDLALTVGYDSDRPHDQRLQRDMQPESGPPLLGDGATRGYEAQSTGRLYARLDRGEHSIAYGDFVTRDAGHPRSLAAYHRSLTGAQTRWEHRGIAVDGFASRDRSSLRIEELPGLGISGPYQLAGAPMIENSERVEIVVRDRHQPSVVVSRSVRQRFVDYEIEPLTGRLVFRAPIPALDAGLDPISIRVSYEVESGGEPFWVAGLESRARLGTRAEVSGTWADDHQPGAERELRGFGLAARLGRNTRVESELATTRLLGEDPGFASRFELAHENGATQGRVWLAATGPRFENPGAGFGPGRTEGGGRLTARLSERTRLTGEALWSADAFDRERRVGLLAALDRPLGRAMRGELGMRVAGERRRTTLGAVPAADPPPSAALRSRLTLQMPNHPAWSGYAEIEQDVRDADRRMAAVGGEHRFATRGRFYARHEVISSLASPFALDASERRIATVAGVDADLARDAHVFSEYRLGDAFAGREAQAAVGLRNGWAVGNGLRLGTSFERVSALGGPVGPATAASVSLEQTGESAWRGSSRFEVRSSRVSDSFLQTLAAAVRLDSAWTALFRHHLDVTDTHGAPGSARLRFQLGTAWRPGGAWDGLGRLEFRYDRDGLGPGGVALSGATPTGSRRRIARILSLQTAGKLDQHFHTSVAWAGKLARDEAIAGATRGGAQWMRGRMTLDLARGWDVGLQSSVLFGNRFGERRYGVGAEVGRAMSPGVWLSAGYNHFGYRDDELTGADWTRAGAYLRLRAKFDERLFGMVADAPGLSPSAPAEAPAPPKATPRDYTGGDPR